MSVTTILLSGSLAKQFGRNHVYDLDSGTTREAFSALKCTIDGFEQFIRQQAKKGVRYVIFRNRENIGEDGLSYAGTNEIRLVPVVGGSKRAGAFQTVLGVALIAAAVIATGGVGAAFAAGAGAWGTAASVGLSLAIGGLYQMLSPQPKSTSSSESDPSYAFGGAVNTTAAGSVVGIGYGERRIGGAIISAGIYAEDISTKS
ncbi:tail assembly protein [Vibrio porteresiae]|uniref:Tail assembly protein n=1 Tax=Vibrio porteresiae DSM 19223 TaxID=1123496 RepID=A0ABZ0QAG0_9VIBR|nr:hypothetical protein [Vibrio porteresiae]WPC72915.1 hypothetical protein R8Z52_12345 [Vibrio porteresiae DSM 19223]